MATASCGQRGNSLVPVEGRVMLGGKPLATGTVILYPDADRGNRSREEPRGHIDANGNYVIYTRIRKGAEPGWYNVAVTAAEQINKDNPYVTHWLVPKKYIDPRTAHLSVQVVADAASGAYDLTLELN